MNKTIIIFKGKGNPYLKFVGEYNQPHVEKDKFGIISKGSIRACLIDTKWGQLHIPFSWIKKKIKIYVKQEGGLRASSHI